jgi:hypothetical protein
MCNVEYEQNDIDGLLKFKDDNTLARMESEMIANDKERKHYNSFSEIMAEIESEDR